MIRSRVLTINNQVVYSGHPKFGGKKIGSTLVRLVQEKVHQQVHVSNSLEASVPVVGVFHPSKYQYLGKCGGFKRYHVMHALQCTGNRNAALSKIKTRRCCDLHTHELQSKMIKYVFSYLDLVTSTSYAQNVFH